MDAPSSHALFSASPHSVPSPANLTHNPVSSPLSDRTALVGCPVLVSRFLARQGGDFDFCPLVDFALK
jgi:hypothetical protein